MTDDERDAAARLIQFVFRNHLHEKKLEKELAVKNPVMYEAISEKEEKEFMQTYMSLARTLQDYRRERVELDVCTPHRQTDAAHQHTSTCPHHLKCSSSPPLSLHCVGTDEPDVSQEFESRRSSI
jgi:hypothetical protein